MHASKIPHRQRWIFLSDGIAKVLASWRNIYPCNLIKVRIIEVLETNVRPAQHGFCPDNSGRDGQ